MCVCVFLCTVRGVKLEMSFVVKVVQISMLACVGDLIWLPSFSCVWVVCVRVSSINR